MAGVERREARGKERKGSGAWGEKERGSLFLGPFPSALSPHPPLPFSTPVSLAFKSSETGVGLLN